MKCKVTGCNNQATCAPSLVFWPPKVIRRFRSGIPIATIVADRECCDECMLLVIEDGYKKLLPKQQFNNLVRAIINAKRQSIEVGATQVVRMEFDEKDYVMLARRLYGADAGMVLIKESLDRRAKAARPLILGMDVASGPDRTVIHDVDESTLKAQD